MAEKKVREQRVPMPSVYPIIIGKDYQFIKKDFVYLFFSHIAYTLFYLVLGIGFFRILCGQRIHGRENLRSLKNKGCISIANHCHFFDTVMTAVAVSPRRPWFASVQRNFEAPYLRKMFRILRAFPIPQESIGLKRILTPVVNAIQEKKIVLFFPEEELWHLCRQIDYFQKGAFYLAHHANCPVLPILHLITPRYFFGKQLFPNWINVKTIIGEPLYPDTLYEKANGIDMKSVEKMTQKAQTWMEKLMNEHNASIEIS